MKNESVSGPSFLSKKAVVVGGLGVAVLLVSAIVVRNVSREKEVRKHEPGQSAQSSQRIIEAVKDINREFAKLQELDENYSVMLGTPGIDIDSADKVILQGEKKFAKTLNEIEGRGMLPSNSDQSLLDSLISSFRLAVLNRQYLSGIRKKLNGNSFIVTPRSADIDKLKTVLLEKERQLKLLSGTRARTSSTNRGVTNDSLAQLLYDEESRTTGLLDALNNLKSENASLRTRNTQLQSGQQKSIDITRYRELEREIEELSAELYLAKVDCSITRADAGKIISTSRQRKQLLSDALQVLDNLSQSANTGVKAKALVKRKQLQEVSDKIRE